MNTHDNDIHTAIMDVITDVWDRAKQIDDAADDVLALIEADRKRRGEPVGYIMPTALKQLKAGGNAIVGGVSQGFDVPIYTVPQVPEGYKLVPIEPTEEMINAATQDGISVDGKPVWKHNVAFQAKWRYQAMLEAAPEVKVPRPHEFNTGNEKLDTLLDDTYYLVEDGGMDNAIKWHESLKEFLASIEPVKVPSDDEIIELRSEFDWREHYGNIRFARALLARYGSKTGEATKRSQI